MKLILFYQKKLIIILETKSYYLLYLSKKIYLLKFKIFIFIFIIKNKTMTEDKPKKISWQYILLAIGVFIIFIILIMNCVYYRQLMNPNTEGDDLSSGCENALQLIFWANIFMTLLSGIILIGLIIMIAMPNTSKALKDAANVAYGNPNQQKPQMMNPYSQNIQQQSMHPTQMMSQYPQQQAMSPTPMMSQQYPQQQVMSPTPMMSQQYPQQQTMFPSPMISQQ